MLLVEQEKLPVEHQELVHTLKQILENGLFTWGSFPIEYPPSKFSRPTSGKRSSTAPLHFVALSQSDDANQLAFNSDGSQKRLSPEQLEELWQTSRFSVSREGAPASAKHVWQVSSLLLRGRENVALEWRKALASAKRNILEEIPARLFGAKDTVSSIPYAAKSILNAPRELVSLLVGLPELIPASTPRQVEDKLRKILRRRLLKDLTPVAHYNGEPIVLQAKDQHAPRIDLRVFNADVMETVASEIAMIFQSVSSKWDQEKFAWERQMREILKQQGSIGAEKIDQVLVDLGADEEASRVYAALAASKTLESRSPGIGTACVWDARFAYCSSPG